MRVRVLDSKWEVDIIKAGVGQGRRDIKQKGS